MTSGPPSAAPAGEIIGHRAAVAFLDNEAAAPAHAYLFAGPSSVGKAAAALRFAAALVGRTAEARARVMRRTHPDAVVIGPEGSAALGVDQVRRAVASASLRPVEGGRKVFIFDDASTMTEAAANALLKTLEEPPAGTVFILVADAEGDLPSTVPSRCRIVRFGRVSEEELASALVERGFDVGRAAMTARISGGRPGLALELAANPEAEEFRRRWLKAPARVSPRPGHGFLLAEEMLEAHKTMLDAWSASRAEADKAEAGEAGASKAMEDRRRRALRRSEKALLAAGLEILASWYLDSASAQYGGPVRNPDLAPSDLVSIHARQAVRSAECVLDAAAQLRSNQRPRLVLAWLFTRLGAGA